MKRVLLDCDGVLADFVGPVLAALNAELGTSFTPDQVTEYDIPKALGLDDKRRRLFYMLANKMAVIDQPVLPGAVAGVRRLREIADVYVVTAPWVGHTTWASERFAWLYHQLGISFRNVVITTAKYLCVGDVFVDDKTSTLVEWGERHPDGIAVQWQATHNRNDGWYGFSTNDWESLAQLVEAKR